MTRYLTLIAIAVSLLSAACSSASPVSQLKSSEPASDAVSPSTGRSAESASAPRQAAPAPAAPGGQSQNTSGTAASVSVPPIDRMIIRTVTMSLLVNSVPDAYAQVEAIAVTSGGSILTSSFKQDAERSSANVSIRIPADQSTYNSTLDQLRRIAVRVSDETVASQDVTEEYVDLESSLRNLQATEARLLSLIEKAQKVEEVITVQRELTNVRGQIERIEGRKKFLERRSDFTTITLTLTDVLAGTSANRAGWNPAETFADATRSLGRALQGFGKAGIWLVVWLPIYGLPLAGVWFLIRRRSASRKATQAS